MLHATARWWNEDSCGPQKNRARKENIAYTIVSDPSGDFATGAKFGVWDVRYMLKMGALDDGAVIERGGQRLVVSGGKLVASSPAPRERWGGY